MYRYKFVDRIITELESESFIISLNIQSINDLWVTLLCSFIRRVKLQRITTQIKNERITSTLCLKQHFTVLYYITLLISFHMRSFFILLPVSITTGGARGPRGGGHLPPPIFFLPPQFAPPPPNLFLFPIHYLESVDISIILIRYK